MICSVSTPGHTTVKCKMPNTKKDIKKSQRKDGWPMTKKNTTTGLTSWQQQCKTKTMGKHPSIWNMLGENNYQSRILCQMGKNLSRKWEIKGISPRQNIKCLISTDIH